MWSQWSQTKQIFVVVFGIHFLFVFIFCLQHVFTREKPRGKIAVRTVQMQPVKSFVAIESVAKVAATTPKKTVKKTAAAPAKKQAVKSSVIQEIEKNLRALNEETKTVQQPRQIAIPSLPQAKQIEVPSETEYNDGEKLIAYLQNTLDLPERGEVKMTLILNGAGRLISCEIIEAQSKKNGEFLKKQLPELAFPCFNPLAKADENFQFTITFKNAENSF